MQFLWKLEKKARATWIGDYDSTGINCCTKVYLGHWKTEEDIVWTFDWRKNK